MNRIDFRVVEYTETPPDTTVVIVGTASNGPSGVPYIITSDKNIYELLGETPLAKAYAQTLASGVSNIILYRTNGTHSTATLAYRDEDNNLTDVLRFKSVSANDLYNSISDDGEVNQIKVSVNGTALIVTNSDGSRRTYVLKDYPSASSLADALNIDAAYGLLDFDTEALIPSFQTFRFTEDSAFEAMFSGADTESSLIIDRQNATDVTATVAELKARLKTALFGGDVDDQASATPNSHLGLLDYGAITVADLYHEDDPELVTILGTFCQNKSLVSGLGCIAAIGTTPVYNPTDAKLADKASRLYSLSPMLKYLSPGGLGEAGAETELLAGAVIPLNYVQIVVGDVSLRTNAIMSPEPFSVVFSYLATLMSLPYYSNVTNKRITGITDLSYEFSKEVIDNLAANGYISIVSSIRKGFVPYSAVTAVGTKSKSSMKKPHYVRISQEIGRILNEKLDDIVGTTRGRASLTLVDGRIKDIMQNLVDSNAIRGYSVACEFLNYNTVLRVTIGFTPYSDVEVITSTTTLPIGGVVF